MNNNTPIQTVNIDKEQLLKQIQKLKEQTMRIRKGAQEGEWRGYRLAMTQFALALECTLPEEEQWMCPGIEKPRTIADALEFFRAELKSP